MGFGTVTHRGAGTDRGAKLPGPLPGAVGAAACSCGLYTFGQGQETAASARLVRESIRYRASAPVSPTAAWEKTAPAPGHSGLWFGAAHERTRGGPPEPGTCEDPRKRPGLPDAHQALLFPATSDPRARALRPRTCLF